MVERFRLSALRTQLGIAIVLVAALTLALTFVAVYRATRADLRGRIDRDLTAEVAGWRHLTSPRDLRSPAALEAAGRRFIANQRYHPESRIFVVDVRGGQTVTNHPAVIDQERARETRARLLASRSAQPAKVEESAEGPGDGLLDAPLGLATVTAEEAGRLRVNSYPITAGGRALGTLRIADPLSSVEQAESRLQRIFLVVGSLALVLALVVSAFMAVLITRPLRRITAVAAEVEAGELGGRVRMDAKGSEVAALGNTLDRMLDRLQHAFTRQRQFVADASHELRTPLAVMRAQVELLEGETDERERQAGMGTLLKALDTMNRLVDDMLTLANADSDQFLKEQAIDLPSFFEDMRRDMPLFGDRDFRVDGPGGTLRADPDRLTQVLRNLIRNAVTHTATGDAVSLDASVHGGVIEFAVSDTGPGIPPSELEQIFERFHSTDHSRRRDRGGSGLGLPIARALVEAHGGRIWAESPPGGGATIRFELPGYAAPPAGG
ncbi:MAG: two-component system, OmpR family, sensor kinase [Thermoleophilaceae bacterium]|nr:two-component system, OmpR family, sensor kinase [Thermoleophilaceae bacterium]